MFSSKEATTLIIASLILAFSVTLLTSLSLFLWSLLSIAIILLVNTLAKKVAGYYFDAEVEIREWTVSRLSFSPSNKFKHPLPMGYLLPIIGSILTFGFVKWMAPTVFEVKATVARAAHRHGLYRFSEMTEDHMAYIAALGIVANVLIAVIGYLINLPPQMNFTALSIYYIFCNVIPISDLDGNKIFFGSLSLWYFLATLATIGLLATFIIV